MRQLFILIDKKRRENCIDFINGLDDKLYSVEIKVYRKNRSLQQNSTWHGWLGIIAEETGNTLEYVKNLIKAKVLGFNSGRFEGVTCLWPKSSKALDVKEFHELMVETETFANDWDINLNKSDDYDYVMGKEVK